MYILMIYLYMALVEFIICSGYGDSYSVLPLMASADDDWEPFQCVAELPDVYDVMNSKLRIQFGNANWSDFFIC